MLAHSAPGAGTTRAGIERAALRLFVTRGLRGTTVRDIAARAGVAEGTLYRHWRSKQDLARSVFRGCAEAVASELRTAAAAERTPPAKLAAAVRALFRCARDEVLLYELLVLPPSRETQGFFARATSPADVLAAIIEEGRGHGDFALTIDPRLAAECILGSINRVAVYRRLGILPRRLAEYENEVSSGLLGCLKPSRRRRRST
jgi:AcrR family transcriptional regulator